MTRARLALLGALVLALWALPRVGLDGILPGGAGPERGGVWWDLTEDPPGGYAVSGPLRVPHGALPEARMGHGGAGLAPEAELRLRRYGALRPLVVELPPDAIPPPMVRLPTRLREGRVSPGIVRTGAGDGGPDQLRLRNEAGVVDTVPARGAVGGDGGEGLEFPLLLEPVRSGWTRWVLEAGSQPPVEWWGWVEPARALRILALSGPPGQEFRFALRALEESGEEVEAWIHLGRGLWTGRGRNQGPPTGEAARALYRNFDLVVLFPGLGLSEAQSVAIEAAVMEAGVGLLEVGREIGHEAGRDQVGRTGWLEEGPPPDDEVRTRPTSELRWEEIPLSVPALPEVDLEVRVRGGDPRPLAVRLEGRGRRAVLPLEESWRWRMEAGAEGEHRAFWHGLAGWLTAGPGSDPVVEILGAAPVPGDPLRIRRVSLEEPASAPDIRIESPDGTLDLAFDEVEALPAGHAAEAVWATHRTGPHRVVSDSSTDEGPASEGDLRGVGAWMHAAPPGTGLEAGFDATGLAVRRALASPGGTVVMAGTAAIGATGVSAMDLRGGLLVLGFLLLAGLAAAEWGVRRARGRP